jgi:predicted RNA-binding protein associated with RNAse of E/G family
MDRVTIEINRVTKPPRTLQEGLLSDDGIEVRTHTELDPEASRKFSSVWHGADLIPSNQFVKNIRKILFYDECFAIMQLLDEEMRPLGCYVDIATPIQKIDSIYHFTDLFLDLWIAPDGSFQELDIGEFEKAIVDGFVSSEWETRARQTFDRLKSEILAGYFPGRYFR